MERHPRNLVPSRLRHLRPGMVLTAAMLALAIRAMPAVEGNAGQEGGAFRAVFADGPVAQGWWEPSGSGFVGRDGQLHAEGTSYCHLVTRHAYGSCVMTWTMTRMRDCGDERAQVVVGAPSGGTVGDRTILWLAPASFQIGQPYRMRLVVLDGEAAVYRRRPGSQAEELLARGVFPRQGRIGFRHYARYAYAYEAVTVAAIDGEAPPAPAGVTAEACPSGIVRLAWQEPEALRGVFRLAIYRAQSEDMRDRQLVGVAGAPPWEDGSVPAATTAFYQLVPRTLAGVDHGAGVVVRVRSGSQPAPGPVAGFLAVPRRGGGVALRWEVPPGMPVREFIVLGRHGPSAGLRELRRLPAGERTYLVALPEERGGAFAVVAENAQGLRGPAGWREPAEPPPLEPAGRELTDLLGAAEQPWQAPAVAAVDPAVTARRDHPRLLFTAEQIARARERIRTLAWARSALADILRRAELGPEGSRFHLALAYALTGEEPYAQRVRDQLVALADRYRGLPLRNGESRIAERQLYENGNLNENGVQAYDLIYHSPALSAADRAHIEADFFRPLIADIQANVRGGRNVFHTAFNHQCHRIASVGMAGFCLGDDALVDWAVRARYGLLFQVGSQLNDDGLWWEKSVSYHVTTAMRPLYELAEAAYNNNQDLWGVQVPDRILENFEDVRYPLDGDNGPKTLKLGFDGFLRLLFPDRTAPSFGDSCANPWYGGACAFPAWRAYRDPALAWFNQSTRNDAFRLLWEEDGPPRGTAFVIGSGRFANTGRAERGSTLFPSSGLAMLRRDEGDPQAPVLAFTYGPYGGGHNHGDRLAFLLYDRGEHPFYRTSTYPAPEYGDYRRSSISYNTVVVDETSHSLRDTADAPNTGRLDFFHADGLVQAVGARADVCYAGVSLRRALLLGPGCLVDVFVCRSADEHQYDYVLHVDSAWDLTGFAATATGAVLGRGNGYQEVELAGTLDTDGLFTTRWPIPPRRPESATTAIAYHLMPAPGTRILACRSPGQEAHRPLRAMLVARRRARSTAFVSVADLGGAPAIDGVELVEASDPAAGPLRLVLEILRGDMVDTVVWHEEESSTVRGRDAFIGRAAWIRWSGDQLVAASGIGAGLLRWRGRELRFPAER